MNGIVKEYIREKDATGRISRVDLVTPDASEASDKTSKHYLRDGMHFS